MTSCRVASGDKCCFVSYKFQPVFSFEKVTPVQVFWQWDFKRKCSRTRVKFDWLVTCGRIAGIHFGGTRPTIFFKLDFKDRRTWNDQRHESWLSDTVELQHCHTTLTWVALLVTTWRCSDSFLRYLSIIYMCIIHAYLFILFPQTYRLLSNFICIGIRLPHQTPIYVHHATCGVTFPETNQTHLQMGRNSKGNSFEPTIHFQMRKC